MKKINVLILGIISIFLFSSTVNATSMDISVECNDIYVGETTTCTIYGNVTGGTIKGVDISLSVSGPVSIQGNPTMGDAFTFAFLNTSNRIVYAGGDSSGLFTIATLKIKGDVVGTGVLSLSNIVTSVLIDDNYQDISVNSVSGSFSVLEKTTKMSTALMSTKTLSMI